MVPSPNSRNLSLNRFNPNKSRRPRSARHLPNKAERVSWPLAALKGGPGMGGGIEQNGNSGSDAKGDFGRLRVVDGQLGAG